MLITYILSVYQWQGNRQAIVEY